MNINGTMELYAHNFKNGVALSTKVSCKDKETGEYQNKYISVYLAQDFENREKVLERLSKLENGYYLTIDVEQAQLLAKNYKDNLDVCIIVNKCKFGKPIKFGSKKTTTKKTTKVEQKEEIDLPF